MKPQFLTITSDKQIKWDSDEGKITSWDTLLTKSFAQLRNNIAHGSKAHTSTPFTKKRTSTFIDEANTLMDYIINLLTDENDWEENILFHN